jgi:hypothetical protein
MEELYVEGLATHDGPESCAGIREGVGEAWTGVRTGRVIEPRNSRFGVPTRSTHVEGNIVGGVRRESSGNPAGSKSHGMYGTFMRENREGPWSARLVDHQMGRLGNAAAVSPR